jgi:aspartate kinase
LSCIVQKFGGTSVATLERIRNVAGIIASFVKQKHEVIVVVSAMAGVTNKFVNYAASLNAYEGDPEYDCLVSSGEQVTSGLLAIALKSLGLQARSYAAWQLPIYTSGDHGRAVIHSVGALPLSADVNSGVVPVVCGFQGVSYHHRVTTLGRGGSDLTAVAVASAVDADLCEIYSDVDGVYTVDPNLYPEARKIDRISYPEMLEMASHGAKVLQEQSVDYAMKKNVMVRVASSFLDSGGTIISQKAPENRFCGLTVTPNLAPLKVQHAPDHSLDQVIALLRRNFIRAEVFQTYDDDRNCIMVDKKKVVSAMNILRDSTFVRMVAPDVLKRRFSLIGAVGSLISPEICEELAAALRHHRVEVLHTCRIEALSKRFSPCFGGFIVPADQLLTAIPILHRHCGLDK